MELYPRPDGCNQIRREEDPKIWIFNILENLVRIDTKKGLERVVYGKVRSVDN